MLSRVADSLYWLSRYLERAEHVCRLTGVYLDLILDQSPHLADERYQHYLKILKLDGQVDESFSVKNLFQSIVFDDSNVNSIAASIGMARENARQVREQMSSETWLQINQLYLMITNPPRTVWRKQPTVYLQEILRNLYLIGGTIDSTMSHDEGWQFIRLGGYLERSSSIAHLIDTHFNSFGDSDAAAEDYFDWVALLKSCTAFEAYCRVYTANLRPELIADFLLLNPEFPHSLEFSASKIHETSQQIAAITKSVRNRTLSRRTGRLRSLLEFGQIDEIMNTGLDLFLADVQTLNNQINESVYQVYISFPVVEELPIS